MRGCVSARKGWWFAEDENECRKGHIVTAATPRILFFVGSLMSGIFLVIAGYCTSSIAVVFNMCLSVGFGSFMSPGHDVNMLDIAPRFAGILMGISNSIGSTSGFLSPMLVGFLTRNKVNNLSCRSSYLEGPVAQRSSGSYLAN